MKNFSIAIIVMILLSFSSPVAAMQPKDDEVSVMTPVIIEFNDKVDKKLLENNGGKIKIEYKLRPAVAVSLPPKAIENLRKNPNIKSIVNDIEIHTMEYGTSYFSDWGIKQIGADIVHYNGIKGETINVAVLDTGADLDHPDLMSNIAHSYDFSGSNDPDASDRDGHGTHVAGTIGALLNGNGVVGVAPDVNLYILKVFTDGGSGSYSDVEEALEWCYFTHSDNDLSNDIQIVSMSLGSEYIAGDSASDPDFEDLVNDLYDTGILLVGAAGNSGASEDNVIYPARYKNVIAVAATDINNNKASFSSTGPAVEISAPGVLIRSTYKNNRYATISGTSMATPHVAGTAALVIASGIIDENGNGRINDEVRTRLIGTAIDLGSEGRDSWYGYGLVDAEAATASMVTLESIVVTPVTASVPKGLTQQYTATRTYSDGSTADITSSVTWASSATAVATIDSEGLATGVGEGSTDITATLDSISDTAALTVTAPILQSITVMPDTATIEVGATQQYTAMGTYFDASTADITSSVAWASSNIAVATIASEGLATGVSDGSTDITATLGSISDTAALTVTAPSEPTTVSVEGIFYSTEGGRDGNKHLSITVALKDDLDQPVASASVSINVNLSSDLYDSYTGTTGTDGTVTFKIPNAPSGYYTTTVINVVTAEGLTWDGVTPLEPKFDSCHSFVKRICPIFL